MLETPQPHEGMDSELKDAAVSGVRWMAGAKVMSDGLQFLAAIALARLIAPSEFGNAAVALILVPLSVIATYEGFGSALVQRKVIEKAHLQAATLISWTAGVLLSIATYLLAPIVLSPILNPEIGHLVQLISPVFALAGIGTVSRARLSRDLDFRSITLIETLGLVLGSIASAIFALMGLDAEAIVLGGVVTTAAASFVLVLVAPPPWPRWRAGELRQIAHFGAPGLGGGHPARGDHQRRLRGPRRAAELDAGRAATGAPSSSASPTRTRSAGSCCGSPSRSTRGRRT